MRKTTALPFISFIAGSLLTAVLLAPSAAAETPCPAPAEQPAPATQPAESVTSAPVPAPRPQVVLNELLPDPTGKDTDGEFIELANLGPTAGDITGWTIVDAKGNRYLLPQTTIAAGGFLALPYSTSKLTLTNDGATISLKDQGSETVSSAAYGAAKEGKSWARGDDGAWSWTTPTPGATNFPATPVPPPATAETTPVQTTPEAPTDPTENSGTETPTATEDANSPETPEPLPPTPIDAIADQDEGAEVIVEGIVTLAPGVVGKTIFAIQDPTGGSGIYVKLSGSAIPELAPGDEVEIVGRVRKKTTPARISARATDVTKTGEAATTHLARDPGEIDPSDAGLAVQVQGSVTDRGTHWLLVSDATGDSTIKVTFPDTVPTVAISKGDTVTADGVVRTTSKGIELVVATRKGITAEKPAAAEEKEPAAKSKPAVRAPMFLAADQAKQRSSAWVWWTVLTVMAAGAVGVAYWKKRREQEGLTDVEH
jgi:hypothetical protein